MDNLTERKPPLAVFSNKPHDFMLKCVDWYLSKWTWGFREAKELEDAGCRTLVDHPLEILALM